MERWRNTINSVISLLSFLAVALILGVVWINRYDPVLTDLVTRNFAAIIGLPSAFLAAFIVVSLFRQADGENEFEAFGFKFKGASGQIVLWIVAFLAISGSIALLWQN